MTSSTSLVVTWQAREDIKEIFRYTEEIWGNDQAEAYDESLHNAFLLLRDFPEMGQALSASGEQRQHLAGNHSIVYRYRDNAVTILRVVNPRRRRR